MKAHNFGPESPQVDATIEQLFAGLREASPSDLEARLLDRLNEREARRADLARDWLFRRSSVAFLGGAVAMAGVVMAITLSQRSSPGTVRVATERPSRSAPRTAAIQDHHPDQIPIRRAFSAPGPGLASEKKSAPVDAREQAMWDDFHAPTQVAPPIPLSPEERKMHRLLRDANARQVASLDPILQELESDRANAAQQRRAADYEQFFWQPPPPPADPPTDSSDQKGFQP
jgi:hypothetical protein